MTSEITSPQYPFDPTGTKTTNKITGELQALQGVTGHDYYFIVPAATPFFEEGLTVVYKSLTGEIRELVPGVDYYPTHYFIGASRSCAKEIYGSITFLNLSLRGSVTLSYQTLGGEWTVDTAKIAELLADQLHNPRTTAWEQIMDVPTLFPVIDHDWNLVDMVGMKDVVAALNLTITAIANNGTSISEQHLNNFDNPHMVTAEQLGAATKADLEAEVRSQIQDLGGGSADNLQDGETNKFFTNDRSLNTTMENLDANATGRVGNGDTLVLSISKLQNQIDASKTYVDGKLALKVDQQNPMTSGIPLDHIERFNITTATTKIDLSKAGSFRGLVGANTTLQFDTSFVPKPAGRDDVYEFALTLVNNATGGYAIVFPPNVQWAGGAVPPRTTTPNSKDSYYFYSEDGMASWMGSMSNEDTR